MPVLPEGCVAVNLAMGCHDLSPPPVITPPPPQRLRPRRRSSCFYLLGLLSLQSGLLLLKGQKADLGKNFLRKHQEGPVRSEPQVAFRERLCAMSPFQV